MLLYETNNSFANFIKWGKKLSYLVIRLWSISFKMYILRPNLVYETSTASDRDGVNGFTIAKIWSKIDIKRTILNISSTPQMETNASTRGRKNGLVWFLYQGLGQMVQQQKLCSFPLIESQTISKWKNYTSNWNFQVFTLYILRFSFLLHIFHLV